jgi:organic hydroperoxide reductase OsmC/OhrA
MEIKVKPKVFSYDVKVRWAAQKHGMLTASGKPDLEVASPPEFKGHPGVWTPEHLYVAAVNACAMLTFLSAATRREIALVAYESDATGILENADGRFSFTRAVLRPRVTVRDQAEVEKARAALQEAEASCLIANSLKTQITIEPEISVLVPCEMAVAAGR